MKTENHAARAHVDYSEASALASLIEDKRGIANEIHEINAHIRELREDVSKARAYLAQREREVIEDLLRQNLTQYVKIDYSAIERDLRPRKPRLNARGIHNLMRENNAMREALRARGLDELDVETLLHRARTD